MSNLEVKVDFKKEYFTMSEKDAIQYAKEILGFFEKDEVIECKEIGDGNLNYVFKIINNETGKSIIVKQAGPIARISDEFKLSPDRNRIESEILKLQGELAEGLVPKVYNYDPIMNCCAMEDLSDHIILRKALIDHNKYTQLATDLAKFMAKTLILTSDVVMEHKEKKELVKSFINPELCEISEDLVYTEPFFDCDRNEVISENREFVKETLWDDKELHLEIADLKLEFMNKAQSLIHGDLHSGSVFVKEGSTKVIDPEFAFYGPAGYDIGNVIAHFIFAVANAKATIKDENEKRDYIDWLKNSIKDTIDIFYSEGLGILKEKIVDKAFLYEGFNERYLNGILKDTAGVAGLELCRRVVGLAQVKDITLIEDRGTRMDAERFCLSIGKELIINRSAYLNGENYIKVIEKFF